MRNFLIYVFVLLFVSSCQLIRTETLTPTSTQTTIMMITQTSYVGPATWTPEPTRTLNPTSTIRPSRTMTSTGEVTETPIPIIGARPTINYSTSGNYTTNAGNCPSSIDIWSHETALDIITDYYESVSAIYQWDIDDAVRERDALRVAQTQAKLDQLTKQYNQEIANENDHWASVLAACGN